MAVILRPTTELVACAWLKGLVGDIVATTLPRPAADGTVSWSDTGFVTLHATSGRPNMYVAMREPVVLIDCWWASPESVKPKWHRANGLAEAIVAGCLDHDSTQRLLTLPTGYPQARVKSAHCVQEPRRPVVPGAGEQSADLGSYARLNLAVQFHWVQVGV